MSPLEEADNPSYPPPNSTYCHRFNTLFFQIFYIILLVSRWHISTEISFLKTQIFNKFGNQNFLRKKFRLTRKIFCEDFIKILRFIQNFNPNIYKGFISLYIICLLNIFNI
jgi:hypothetical protein